ncbi:uncharacterized protein LOC122265588 isoform X2 [Penaeus japonicus]|uniref:uncharacterized protein LOC122265588 isoform X2 n=1 Tax=Penaeus japonicus TaxID=27405 RepID=UPI001C717A66|nr:uncharacterized protein LOC122265588 isoform X2 [Penaeus japonicus]
MTVFRVQRCGLFLVLLVWCGTRNVESESPCREECGAVRLNGAWVPFDDGPRSVWWWPLGPSVSTWMVGSGVNGPVNATAPHRWHQILMEREYGSYCLSAPALWTGRFCKKKPDSLYLYSDQPSFFSFDCDGTPCGCSIERLLGVYVPVTVAATDLFWWPGPADLLGVESLGINEYYAIESARDQWHHIITTGHEGTSSLQCAISSKSLNLTLHCIEDELGEYDDVKDIGTRVFLGSYRQRSQIPTYWAFGCNVAPGWCPDDAAECLNQAAKVEKEVDWWMELVIAVEVIFLVIGLIWLWKGIFFQIRKRRTQKTKFNRIQRSKVYNREEETKNL